MIKTQSNEVINETMVCLEADGSPFFFNTMLIRSFIIPCLNLPGNYKVATIILLDRLLFMISLSLSCKDWFTLEAAGFHLCR